MESTLAVPQKDETSVIRIPMSKERFLNWNPDDDFVYEFDNGFAEPTTGMKKDERYLIINIQDKFSVLPMYQQGTRLLAETDCWLTKSQMRRPDLSLFTREDIRVTDDSAEPIPTFVVEIISPSDKADHVETKLIEYFNAQVRVVWHIYPALRMVRVFTSPRYNVTCFEDDPFSAAPAVPDLRMTVGELFAR